MRRTIDERKLIIDEYGELSRRVSSFAPVLAQQKKLKETIASWYEDQPDSPCEADGKLYRVQISPCATERKITNMRRLYRLIGVGKFLDWCTFPLSAVDRLTSDQSSFIESTQTGPRKITAVLIEAAKPAKQAA